MSLGLSSHQTWWKDKSLGCKNINIPHTRWQHLNSPAQVSELGCILEYQYIEVLHSALQLFLSVSQFFQMTPKLAIINMLICFLYIFIDHTEIQTYGCWMWCYSICCFVCIRVGDGICFCLLHRQLLQWRWRHMFVEYFFFYFYDLWETPFSIDRYIVLYMSMFLNLYLHCVSFQICINERVQLLSTLPEKDIFKKGHHFSTNKGHYIFH